MVRVLLAINEPYVVVPAQSHQSCQRNLGAVCGSVKHRFTEHHLAYADAIQSPDHLTFSPRFHAVSKTRSMELDVGIDHF